MFDLLRNYSVDARIITQFTSLTNPPFPSHSPPLSLAKLNSKQGHKVILSPTGVWAEHSDSGIITGN